MVEVEASQQVSADGDGFRSKSKGIRTNDKLCKATQITEFLL